MKKQTMILSIGLLVGTLVFSSCSKELPSAPAAGAGDVYTASSQKQPEVEVTLIHGYPRMQGDNPETFECVQLNPPRVCFWLIRGGGEIVMNDFLNDFSNNEYEYGSGVAAANVTGQKPGPKKMIINHLDAPQMLDVSTLSASSGTEAHVISYDAQ